MVTARLLSRTKVSLTHHFSLCILTQSVIKAERERRAHRNRHQSWEKTPRDILHTHREEKERVLFVYRVREKKRETQNSFIIHTL